MLLDAPLPSDRKAREPTGNPGPDSKEASKVNETLGPKEIDAILGQARTGRNEPDAGDQRVIQPCDFRSAGQMSEGYARFMTTLFEPFARSASNSLGAYFT